MALQNAFGDLALEETLRKVQRGTPDQDQRYEFGSIGGENKPLYVGQAPPGTPASDESWVIQRYTWAAAPNGTGNVPVLVQTRVGAWDNRAALF